MNKALDSDDEDNLIKRRSRTKYDLSIVRPWQNDIMSDFMKILFKESGSTVLFKQTITNKFNEAGVPLTWQRIQPYGYFFEKKTAFPPWDLKNKVTVVMPMKSAGENLEDLEVSIIRILKEKVEREGERC